ncbi:MAG: hypothetical protein IPH50_14570, partial [Rhodanobacteraceae bacterium]|nr:hypothetical protein [Rhodanobacteraceae bacterium]
MKALFRDFVEQAGFLEKPGPVGLMVKRNIEGFRLIERTVTCSSDITVESVLRAFQGDTTHRKYRVVKNWFAMTLKLDFHGPEAQWFRHTAFV